ncbi:hypothetical protein D3C81_2124440 [compost metagenome]
MEKNDGSAIGETGGITNAQFATAQSGQRLHLAGSGHARPQRIRRVAGPVDADRDLHHPDRPAGNRFREHPELRL